MLDPKELTIEIYTPKGSRGRHLSRAAGVRIRHLPSDIVVFSEDSRCQFENRDKAIKLLEDRLRSRDK